LCKYILRPPLANDRLKILDDKVVRLEFKKPWSGVALGELAGPGGPRREASLTQKNPVRND
jgi:hypothetical protein